MEKLTYFRDRVEVEPDDLTALQDSAKSSIDHVVADAVSDLRRIHGFTVTKETQTSVRVAAGRLYEGGKVFVAESDAVMNLQALLPVVNRIVVSIYAFSQEIDTDVQERMYAVDISVTPPIAEPRPVPMTRLRLAQLNVVKGLESVDPQPAALPSNSVLVATVLLLTTGVADGGIAMATENGLPNMEAISATLRELAVWRAQTSAKVDSLTSEQAALAARTIGKADVTALTGVMTDVAKIKRLMALPTAGAPYDTDLYADSEGIDQALTPADTNYRISSFGGADFPYAAHAVAPLGLFNPYDTSVYRNGDFVLPAFDEVLVVEVPGYSGELNISQYPITTTVVKEMTGTKTETRYGWA